VQKALEVFEGEWADFVGKPSSICVADLPEDAETREGELKELAEKLGEESEEVELEEIEVEGEEDDDPRTRGIRGRGGGVVIGSGWRRTLKGTRIRIDEYRIWNIRTPTGVASHSELAIDVLCYLASFWRLTMTS
jgi:hypothetical protein